MKIGIMGGTFNPIHNGHLMLGASAYSKFSLDKVWFLPNGHPPHKENEINAKDRIEMVRLAIENDPRFLLNTYEAEKTETSFSFETLEQFQILYPDFKFYFIVGADSLFSIESWREPARVMKACTLLAACRDDKYPADIKQQITYLESKYKADIRFLKSPYMEISSSDIRRMTESGIDISSYVPKKVADYIESHHLYQL